MNPTSVLHRRLGNDAFIGSGQVAEIEDDVTNCSLAHAARDELRSEKRVAAVVQVMTLCLIRMQQT